MEEGQSVAVLPVLAVVAVSVAAAAVAAAAVATAALSTVLPLSPVVRMCVPVPSCHTHSRSVCPSSAQLVSRVADLDATLTRQREELAQLQRAQRASETAARVCNEQLTAAVRFAQRDVRERGVIMSRFGDRVMEEVSEQRIRADMEQHRITQIESHVHILTQANNRQTTNYTLTSQRKEWQKHKQGQQQQPQQQQQQPQQQQQQQQQLLQSGPIASIVIIPPSDDSVSSSGKGSDSSSGDTNPLAQAQTSSHASDERSTRLVTDASGRSEHDGGGEPAASTSADAAPCSGVCACGGACGRTSGESGVSLSDYTTRVLHADLRATAAAHRSGVRDEVSLLRQQVTAMRRQQLEAQHKQDRAIEAIRKTADAAAAENSRALAAQQTFVVIRIAELQADVERIERRQANQRATADKQHDELQLRYSERHAEITHLIQAHSHDHTHSSAPATAAAPVSLVVSSAPGPTLSFSSRSAGVSGDVSRVRSMVADVRRELRVEFQRTSQQTAESIQLIAAQIEQIKAAMADASTVRALVSAPQADLDVASAPVYTQESKDDASPASPSSSSVDDQRGSAVARSRRASAAPAAPLSARARSVRGSAVGASRFSSLSSHREGNGSPSTGATASSASGSGSGSGDLAASPREFGLLVRRHELSHTAHASHARAQTSTHALPQAQAQAPPSSSPLPFPPPVRTLSVDAADESVLTLLPSAERETHLAAQLPSSPQVQSS